MTTNTFRRDFCWQSSPRLFENISDEEEIEEVQEYADNAEVEIIDKMVSNEIDANTLSDISDILHDSEYAMCTSVEISEINEEGLSGDIEEEIIEVIEFTDKVEEECLEKIQDQPSASSRENTSYTDRSKRSDGLQEALEEERRARAALQEALEKEKRANAQQKEALRQERKEKDALATTLKKEQAENVRLCAEMEHMKAKVAHLKKSCKEHQRRKNVITEMSAHLEEGKKHIEQLKSHLEVSSSLHKEETDRNKVFCAEIKALKKRLAKQEEKSLEKDKEIQALNFEIHTLQSSIEAKDNVVFLLQEKDNQWASDLREIQDKNCTLQSDYETAVSQQQQKATELYHLTQENRRLASENKRLQLCQNQLQEDREAYSRLEEAIKMEQDQFSRANEKIKMQEKELSEKTQALEKSRFAETFLRSSLKSEKKRFKQIILQKQASVDPLTILSNQLREASASSEHLRYDMQTLRMENKNIRAKFEAKEREFEIITSKYHSLSECHEKMISTNTDTISENQSTIVKLQSVVDELKAQESESKTREAELKDALKQEKARTSELQKRADEIGSAFNKVRTMCEKLHVELKEAITKQIETLEEKQKLAVALQKVQDEYFMLQERQLTKSQNLHTSVMLSSSSTSSKLPSQYPWVK